MESIETLRINNPCKQQFSDFKKTKNGGFCASCSKEVIDFTQWEQSKIIAYLRNTEEQPCGRLQLQQLKTMKTNSIPKRIAFLYATRRPLLSGVLMGLLMTTCLQAKGQMVHANPKEQARILGNTTNKKTVLFQENQQEGIKIKGRVTDPDGLPLGGVNVILKGSSTGSMTDLDGYFEFPTALTQGEELVFSFLGYETITYSVKAEDGDASMVSIQFEESDVVLMGEIQMDGVYSSKPSFFERILRVFRK